MTVITKRRSFTVGSEAERRVAITLPTYKEGVLWSVGMTGGTGAGNAMGAFGRMDLITLVGPSVDGEDAAVSDAWVIIAGSDVEANALELIPFRRFTAMEGSGSWKGPMKWAKDQGGLVVSCVVHAFTSTAQSWTMQVTYEVRKDDDDDDDDDKKKGRK